MQWSELGTGAVGVMGDLFFKREGTCSGNREGVQRERKSKGRGTESLTS